MTSFDNFRLAHRMSLGFGAVLLLLTAIVALTALRFNGVRGATDKLINEDWIKAEAVQRLEASTRAIAARTLELLLTADETRVVDLRRRIEDNARRGTEAVQTLQKLVVQPQAQQLLAEALAARGQFSASFKQVDIDLQAGDRGTAADRVRSEMVPLMDKLLVQTQSLAKFQLEQARASGQSMADGVHQDLVLITALGVLALLVGSLAAWVLTRSITRPIAQAVDLSRRVAAGDLTVAIDATRRDEIGDLLRALREMNTRLAQVVGSVRDNAESVATASAQIAQGNQDLSQRTEEQAGALQQTAASMAELGSTVQQNADNARQADGLAQAASQVAERGGQVVGQVVQTMQGIHDGSRRIADIIGTIDGIAFQTNILALNAAVEAARAGEQGRGFAVVAGEVRSLAQRSAEAAREIKTLISSSVEQVEQGSALVEQAGSTMREVVGAIRRVSDIVGEISAASEAQTAGVSQIGEAVGQMDQTTQQNAALVEQSAAAADSLRQQAGQLVDAVSVFTLGQGRATAAPARPAPALPLRPAAATLAPAPAPAPVASAPRETATSSGDWASF